MSLITLNSILTVASSAESSENADILQTLGIDIKILIFQIIGFLVLVLVLKKYVYPVLMRAVDARHEANEAGLRAAQQAEAKASQASQEIDEAMVAARAEARDAIANAKNEAAAILADAETKARLRAERIVADGQDQIRKDVLSAKRELKGQTIDLIALASEKVLSAQLGQSNDQSIMNRAIKDAEAELTRG